MNNERGRNTELAVTVVVDVEELPLEQVTKQLNKLINVIKIVELEPSQAVQREHLLIKVRVDNTSRSQILEAVTLFRARVVDVATEHGDAPEADQLLVKPSVFKRVLVRAMRPRQTLLSRAGSQGRVDQDL